MTKPKEQRKKIFDLYAQNLKNVCDSTNLKLFYSDDTVCDENVITKPVILCPLCMKIYGSEALGEEGIDRLTIEHIPPKSVGGKGKILICKLCNDKAGIHIDHHIQTQLYIEPFSKGINNSKVEGRIKIGNEGIPIPATFSYEGETIVIKTHKKKSNRKAYSLVFDDFKFLEEGSQLHMSVKGNKSLNYHIGLLKSAFLEMFYVFGHIFLINSNSQLIRQQIETTDKWILPHSSVLDMGFDKAHVGVNILYEPFDRISYLVILDLISKETGYNRRVGVLIPGPGKLAWETYSNYKDCNGFECKLTHITGVNCIEEKKLSLFYNDIWKDVCEKKWGIKN